MSYKWKLSLSLLMLVAVLVWLAVLAFPKKHLRLIACDVGQGDAILATYGATQILVDGGPNDKVLDCLASHMPFWDREIELVVLTHPQTDHFKGLIEVFKRYSVQNFLTNSLDSSSQEYEVLKSVVGGSDTTVHDVANTRSIRLGLMHLDIVHPSSEFLVRSSTRQSSKIDANDENVLGDRTSSKGPNDFSIVVILRLGEFDALLTGDIGPNVMDEVIEQFALSGSRRIEYVKIPHHGSKNGLTQSLLNASSPEVAVISVGSNNRYGHPHEEVIKLLSNQGIKILRTDEIGSVVVESDGERWWVDNY